MPNLDTLKDEIEQYLTKQGFAIFRGYSRAIDSTPAVYWDCDRYPDYKSFLETAKTVGASLVVYHQHEFSSGQVDAAVDRLEQLDLPRDEARAMERRLKEMRVYEGFTCAIELSFDHGGRIYVFDLRTEWYDELSDLLDEINMTGTEPDEDDDSPMSGYFSKN